MATFQTALTTFSDTENKRTYIAASTHTTIKPRLLIQSRKLATGNEKFNTMTYRFVYGTVNSGSLIIPDRYSVELVHRFPIDGATADRDALLAHVKDIVSCDEYAASYATFTNIKA